MYDSIAASKLSYEKNRLPSSLSLSISDPCPRPPLIIILDRTGAIGAGGSSGERAAGCSFGERAGILDYLGCSSLGPSSSSLPSA